MDIQKHNINKAAKLLNQGSGVATTTYSAATYYKRNDGSIWMSHPSYNDRKFFKNISEFKSDHSYSGILFYQMEKQYNPNMVCRYIIKYTNNFGIRLTDAWNKPRYGTIMRKEANILANKRKNNLLN